MARDAWPLWTPGIKELVQAWLWHLGGPFKRDLLVLDFPAYDVDPWPALGQPEVLAVEKLRADVVLPVPIFSPKPLEHLNDQVEKSLVLGFEPLHVLNAKRPRTFVLDELQHLQEDVSAFVMQPFVLSARSEWLAWWTSFIVVYVARHAGDWPLHDI